MAGAFQDKIEYLVGEEKGLTRAVAADTPFSEGRLSFLQELSRLLRQDKRSRDFPDVASYAFWIRRASMLAARDTWMGFGQSDAAGMPRMGMPSTSRDFPDANPSAMEERKRGDKVFRLGRGTIFHIAPSNVAVNYAYSFAAGFISGNRNIVRLPSRDFPQVSIINEAIREALSRYPDYIPYVYFVRYDRNSDINNFFSAICDVRVIWGGDGTIREIRKSPLPPRATEVCFADRYSLMVVDADAYLQKIEEEDAANQIARDFYNDTLLTDQNACTSPHLLAWIGEGAAILKAKEKFWGAFFPLARERYPFQEIQGVDKLDNLCLAAACIGEGRLKKASGDDNLLWRVQLSGGLTDAAAEVLQERRGNAGFFYEMDIKDIRELLPLCNGKTQTIGYIGDADMFYPLLRSGILGVDRIVPVGHTMDFSFLWDGYDLLERFTRCIPVVKR